MSRLNKNVIRVETLVMAKTKAWCRLAYPGHPRGCPKYAGACFGKNGRKKQRFIDEFIDTSKPMYIVYNEFDLEAFSKSLKARHPDWSDRQTRCVLYWQKGAKKSLREKVKCAVNAITPKPDFIESSPEEFGVNLYATCLRVGLKLDPINRMKICRHMALVGYKKSSL